MDQLSHMSVLAQRAPDVAWLATVVTGLMVAIALAAVIFARRDLGRFSARRLWALAMLMFRESIRRRVLVLVPGAMLLIVCLGLFQRSFDEIDDVRQAVETCVRASSALTIVLVLLLSAFSFPREMDSRTIYTLMAKPVTRLEVLLGKFVGLCLVAAAVLGLMGAFSYGYLAWRGSRALERAKATVARQQADFDLSRPYLAEQPTTAPAAGPIRRYEPPDPALVRMVESGPLSAMNLVGASEPMSIQPDPPRLAAGDWQWMLAGPDYMAVYQVNLPPPGRRGHGLWRFKLKIARPAPAGDEPLRLRVFLYPRTWNGGPGSQLSPSPPQLQRRGWPVTLGDGMAVTASADGAAAFELPSALMDAMGPTPAVAVGVMVRPAPDQRAELVGVLPDGLKVTMDVGPNQAAAAAVADFVVLPRVQASTQLGVHGSPPGGPSDYAVFEFAGLDSQAAADELVFRLDCAFEKGTAPWVISWADVTVVNPRTGGDPLHRRVYPGSQRGGYFSVPRSFAAGGRLVIKVRPAHEADLIGLRHDSVQLVCEPTGLLGNLAKSLAICMIQALPAAAIGLMGSTFLSWPVALLLSTMVLVAGNVLEMVRGISAMLDNPAVNKAMTTATGALACVIPDFTRFEPLAYIQVGLSIPVGELAADAWWGLLYTAVALVIGYLAFRFKEVAR